MSNAAPDWIAFQPARWMAGTAEMDGPTEYVFFRLCVIAYETNDALVGGTDRRNAMRCKTTLEEYKEALEMLVELEKIVIEKTGIFVKSASKRLVDASSRIEGRRRGAAIARRRGVLKKDGVKSTEIDQIIKKEFPDNHPDHQAPYNTKQTEQDKTEQDKQGGVGGNQLELTSETLGPTDAQTAFDMWNILAAEVGLVKAQAFDSRKSNFTKRLDECGGLEGWQIVMDKIRNSDFLTGKKTDWKCDIDFVLRKSSFTKIMEGSYDNNGGGMAASLDRIPE